MEDDEGYVDISSFLDLTIKSEPVSTPVGPPPRASRVAPAYPYYPVNNAASKPTQQANKPTQQANKRPYSELYSLPAKRPRFEAPAPRRISDVTIVDINQLLGNKTAAPSSGRQLNYSPGGRPSPVRRPPRPPFRPDLRTNPFARPRAPSVASVLRTKPEITLLPLSSARPPTAPILPRANNRYQLPPNIRFQRPANNISNAALTSRMTPTNSVTISNQVRLGNGVVSGRRRIGNSPAFVNAVRPSANRLRDGSKVRLGRGVDYNVRLSSNVRLGSDVKLQPIVRLHNIQTQLPHVTLSRIGGGATAAAAQSRISQKNEVLSTLRNNKALTLTAVGVGKPMWNNAAMARVFVTTLKRYPELAGCNLQPKVAITRINPGDGRHLVDSLYCYVCNRKFTRRQDIALHNVARHGAAHAQHGNNNNNNNNSNRKNKSRFRVRTKVKVECEICFQILSSNYALMRHMKTHQDLLNLVDVDPTSMANSSESEQTNGAQREEEKDQDLITNDVAPLVQFPAATTWPSGGSNVLDDLNSISSFVDDLFSSTHEPEPGSDTIVLSDSEEDEDFIDPASFLLVDYQTPPTEPLDDKPAAFQSSESTVDLPAVDPVDTSVEPVDTSVEPINTSVEVIDSSVKPIEASVERMDMSVEPIEAIVESMDTSVDPVGPIVESVVTSVEPTNTSVEPTSTSVEVIATSVDASVSPIEAIVEAVNTSVEPFNTSVEPVNTSVEPVNTSVEASVEPNKAKVESNDSSVEPMNTSVEPMNMSVEVIDMSDDPMVSPIEAIVEAVNTLIEPVNTLIEPVNTLIESVNTSVDPIYTSVEASLEPINTSVEGSLEPNNTLVEGLLEPINTSVEASLEPINTSVEASLEPNNTSVEPMDTSVDASVEPIEASDESPETSVEAIETSVNPVNVLIQSIDTSIDSIEFALDLIHAEPAPSPQGEQGEEGEEGEEGDDEVEYDDLTLRCDCCAATLPTVEALVAHLKSHISMVNT